ncbi:MAG TPA: GTPase Era, partial [Sphingomicrobium sp.]|nr:GTPase Era [Sphingomicrobium sp.]
MSELLSDGPTRAGFAAVIGAPNAGKSTLVNALVGQKVAIVSAKAQTTRARLMGIAIEGQSQILLVDTPGIFQPKRRLDRAMVAAAWNGAGDADLILLVVDSAQGVTREVERIVQELERQQGPQPLVLALNKIDLVKKADLLGLSAE